MIEVHGLSHRYSKSIDERPALDQVSLRIGQGEHVAILGRNGCGKSTLAKHLNALLLPTEGQVLIDGLDTSDETETLAIRQKVGMVFQNPDNQLVATTVEEDVAFGPENIGLAPALIAERVSEALETVRMTAYRHAAPYHLSGGQKQRIAIAGIIAMRPSYIVFDEPTAMLDPQGRAEVIETMLSLQKEGIAVINITHFMEEAVLAERVIVMDAGHIVMEGRPEDIFTEVATLKRLHLDVPAVTELAARLQDGGADIPKHILTIDDMVEAVCRSYLNK